MPTLHKCETFCCCQDYVDKSHWHMTLSCKKKKKKDIADIAFCKQFNSQPMVMFVISRHQTEISNLCSDPGVKKIPLMKIVL